MKLDWKIRNKLLGGFCLVLVLLVVIGGYSIFFTKGIDEKTQTMGKIASVDMDIVKKLSVPTYQMWQLFSEASATGSREGLARAEQTAVELRGFLNDIPNRCVSCHQEVFKANPSAMPDAKASMAMVGEAFEKFFAAGKKMTGAHAAGGREAGSRAKAEFDAAASELKSNLEMQEGVAQIHADGSWKAVSDSTSRARWLTIALTLAAIALGIALALFIASRIVEPVTKVADAADAMARGEVNLKVDISSHDEVGQLAENMNALVSKVKGVIAQVKASASSVAQASREISEANQDLSQRTSEQAASLEQTAASMEEMASSVNQNAENAAQANSIADDARSQAEAGGHVVAQAVDAMEAIKASSKKIADIISVIDEIAFQTNLLALNAAVEAARAGEQGRGFAVVAGEVRNLAQRSAEAAKEIKDLIEDSVAKVEHGSQMVDASGKTLEELVSQVGRLTEAMAEIATASGEQSAGIEEVNRAVAQMDEVTHQNAALVEQMASASKEMAGQAEALIEQVAFFRTGDDGSAAKAHKAARPRESKAAGVELRSLKSVGKAKALEAAAFERKGNGREAFSFKD